MRKNCIFLVISLLIAANYCTGAKAAKSHTSNTVKSLTPDTIKSLVPEAEQIVLAGLKNPEPGIRAIAVEVISESKKTEMMKNIIPLFDDLDPRVRFSVAIAAGDMKYKESEKKLKQLLKDSDLNVATAGAYALYQFGDEKYLRQIEDAASSSNQVVQANAAMLLGKMKNPHSLPILYKLKDSQNASDVVAFNAVEAIAQIGDEKIYSKIWTMLISVYPDDRYMGIHVMASFGGSKGANAILTLLDDNVPEVRLAAAERLGFLGDTSGQVIILEFFNSPPDPEKAVSEKRNVLAALAIGQIGTEPLIGFLPKMLKNESVMVQLAASKSVFMLARVH